MIDDRIRRLVDAMPPLTEKQRDNLTLLFRGAPRVGARRRTSPENRDGEVPPA